MVNDFLSPPLRPESHVSDLEHVSLEVVTRLSTRLDVLETPDAVVKQYRHAQRTGNRPKRLYHIRNSCARARGMSIKPQIMGDTENYCSSDL